MPSHLINNCVCERCGKGFYIRPSYIAAGCGNFCSKECRFPNQHSPLVDRFFDLIGRKTESGCVLWAGRVHKRNGYGLINPDNSNRSLGAHRLSYELMIGPIPDGLYVLHRCDNRLCILPTHLFVGTQLENMQDCVAKGRQARGEMLGRSKLTVESIMEIRRRCGNGESQYLLATHFGVCQQVISDIKRRKTWKHVG